MAFADQGPHFHPIHKRGWGLWGRGGRGRIKQNGKEVRSLEFTGPAPRPPPGGFESNGLPFMCVFACVGRPLVLTIRGRFGTAQQKRGQP